MAIDGACVGCLEPFLDARFTKLMVAGSEHWVVELPKTKGTELVYSCFHALVRLV